MNLASFIVMGSKAGAGEQLACPVRHADGRRAEMFGPPPGGQPRSRRRLATELGIAIGEYAFCDSRCNAGGSLGELSGSSGDAHGRLGETHGRRVEGGDTPSRADTR